MRRCCRWRTCWLWPPQVTGRTVHSTRRTVLGTRGWTASEPWSCRPRTEHCRPGRWVFGRPWFLRTERESRAQQKNTGHRGVISLAWLCKPYILTYMKDDTWMIPQNNNITSQAHELVVLRYPSCKSIYRWVGVVDATRCTGSRQRQLLSWNSIGQGS